MRSNEDLEGSSPWHSIIIDIVETIRSIVATFDSDGRLLFLNEAGRRLLGADETAIVTDWLLSDLYDERESERIHREALPTALREGVWSGETMLRTASGRPLASRQHLIAHRDHLADAERRVDRRLPRFTVVAELIQDESALTPDIVRRNRREALEASSLGLLHGINNLLAPILTYTELAEGRLQQHSAAARYVEQARRAAERAHAISQKVSSRLAPTEQRREAVRMTAIVEEIAIWLRVEHAELEVDRDLDPASTDVTRNEISLHQAILNLGRNAVEACRSGGRSVSMALESSASACGRRLRLTVRDEGEGISPEDMPHIFEPFFSTKPNRSGLGLSISRQIFEAHGGTIDIASALGRGTIVTVELPSVIH